MNRDREALIGLIEVWFPEGPWGAQAALADAILSLPVGGGVEEADLKWLLQLVKRQAYTGHYGEENSEISARHDNDKRIARILAALSPTTLGGGIQGRLAAKDGAAAPPQAPVAGSEPSASEVAE